MPNFVKITFPATGCTYELPCEAIIAHRAQVLAGPPPPSICTEEDVKKVMLARPLLTFEEALEATKAWAQSEFAAWVSRVNENIVTTRELFADVEQMRAWLITARWEHLGPHARILVFKSAPREFADAVLEFEDEPGKITEPTNENQADVPTDMLESMLRERDGNIIATTVNGPDGTPFGAFIYVRGNAESINAYLGLAHQLAEQLKKHPDGVVPPRIPYNH